MGDILHNLNDVVLSAHVYTQVFTTSSTAIVLNGTSLTLAPPMVLDIRVRSLSAATPTTVFLIGEAVPNVILNSDRGIILLLKEK